ncbi:MSHA biogenesis protein MshK [Parashewanella spongiae]|uniref:MSHA biogenesis protein MshK n=1 Tax=Parashewanella spongiae TaxID=342950 RepID=UPI00105966A5|nr:MSHA biogenesis protein MshK [Parashewanella spongiae]
MQKLSSVFIVSLTLLALLNNAVEAQTKDQTLRDPTQPSKFTALRSDNIGNNGKLTLNSIVTGSQPFIVVNDEIKTIGDSINNVKIIQIETNSVELADGRRLTLFETITKSKGK